MVDNSDHSLLKDCADAIFHHHLDTDEFNTVQTAFLDDFRHWRELILNASCNIVARYKAQNRDVMLGNYITCQDVEKTFKSWLRRIDQSQSVQDACITQLRIYLVHICEDIFFLESDSPKSSWIWSALTNWDYLTYSMSVPSEHWDLGDAFNLNVYTSHEPTHSDIASFSNLSDIQ